MFHDRYDAARQLALALARFRGRKDDTVILAIPRGALLIGETLHEELGLPLDIIITKKIPHPLDAEFAIGAVGSSREYFVNDIEAIDIPTGYIDKKVEEITSAILARYKRYRGDTPLPELKGKNVIIVDDGIATGSTMIAAIRIVRKQEPKAIIVAVPVAPLDAIEKVKSEADAVICLLVPELFSAIGQFYEDFRQVEDDEAIAILARCR